jgi:hypothetical protein
MSDETAPTNGQSGQLTQSTGRHELWDPLPDETTKAYDAFCRYRDLAGKRSFTLVAQSLNCSLPNITRWSGRFRWSERAIAFDAHMDQKHRDELARERLAMRTRQAAAGHAMQTIAAHAIRELQQKIEMKLPLGMSVGEISQLMAEGSKLERAALGEDAENRFTQIVVNLGDADDEPDADGLTLNDATPDSIQ